MTLIQANDQTMKIKNEIHSSNIDKRGNVKKSLTVYYIPKLEKIR